MHAAPAPRSLRPRPGLGFVLALLVAATLVTPRVAQAQDVRYKTVHRTEWAGFMSTVMSLSGEDVGPDTTTTWIKGALRREDQADGQASWILDLGSMDMSKWNHEERVWWTMNFRTFMASADSSMAEARQEMTDEDRARMSSFEPSMEVDRTGETRTINGWEAERVLITLTLEPSEEALAEGQAQEDPMATMMGRSSMVMLSDLWISDDLPGYEQMKEAMGGKAQDFAGGSGGMEALAVGYPQMAALAEQLREEMEGLEGEAVRSTVYTVMVPAASEFDRDSILALSDAPLAQGPDLSDLLAQAAAAEGKDAAVDAARQAMGRLGGLLGGRDDDEEKEMQTAASPGPTVMTRLVTEIIDVERPTLSESDFQPPAGYKEVPGPSVGG
ncbi:MAG: hypothetical protein P8188_07930 [Gemmatimonadota bacterium]|jgi:hypothetical protein